MLGIVALLWGATFPLTRNAVALLNPIFFVACTFILAAIVIFPFALPMLRQTNRQIIISGLILGLINSVSFVAQTISLQTVSSSKAAFITGMYVIIVPLIMPLMRLGKPRPIDWIAACVCVVGLFILTGANLSHLSRGDLWVLLAAFSFAAGIAYLTRATMKIPQVRLLVFYQILFTIPVPLLLSPQNQYHLLLKPAVIAAVLFVGILATGFTLILQTTYQKYTTANRAALIYSMEPIFASIFAVLFNNEILTWQIIAGGLVILCGILFPLLRQKNRPIEAAC